MPSSPGASSGVTEVLFSNAAVEDLVAIDKFSVVQFGEDAAFHYMHGFDEAFARLRDFPRSGRLLPELGEGIRCLIHRRHRIFHVLTADGVLVVRIVHHARDAGNALEGLAS